MNDFWWGCIAGAFSGVLIFIGWFLCSFDVNWDFSGDDE